MAGEICSLPGNVPRRPTCRYPNNRLQLYRNTLNYLLLSYHCLHLLYILFFLIQIYNHGMLARSDRLASRREDTAGYSTLTEQQWDVLKLYALGLRVKQVDHGNEKGIQDGEYDKRPPADIVCQAKQVSAVWSQNAPFSGPKVKVLLTKRDRCYLHDGEDSHPVPSRCYGLHP